MCSTFAVSASLTPGRMSAFNETVTRGACAATASTACLITAITSSHSPSTVVNMASVRFGNPEARTTRTASATASPTLPSSLVPGPPLGAMLKAKSMVASLPQARCPAPLLASQFMSPRDPLPFDPILRAASLWDERIGSATTMAAVTSVMRVQQILLSAVDGALRPLGLTFARYEALVLLTFSRTGRLPMRVMGERLQLHPTSVTNIVDRLEADGLVRRIPHPTDRRATLVEITDEGSAQTERATSAVTTIDFGLTGLDGAEQDQLTALLTKVRRAAGDFIAP